MRTLAALACLLAFAAPPAQAGFSQELEPTLVCRLGRVPGSTLLLPYFEVHPKKGKADTRIVIQNASPQPVLAHVTLWTDRAVPVLAFDVPVTGFDIVRLSFYDLLFAPRPALAGVYASICGDPRAELDAGCLGLLRAALAGGEAAPGSGQCASWDYGDGRLRGYATVDADAGSASPAESNLLLGDFELREKKAIFAGPLVHLRGSEEQPLTGAWTARFENGLAPPRRNAPGTELVVWRDLVDGGTFPCGAPPADGQVSEIVAFDETGTPAPVDAAAIPAVAAQRIRLGSPFLAVPFDAGTLRLHLDHPSAGARIAYVASLLRRQKAAHFLEAAPLCAPQ